MTYTFADLSGYSDFFSFKGIDDQGQIFGNAIPVARSPSIGYIVTGTALTTFAYQPIAIAVPDDPLALRHSTYAVAINNAGTIVGNYEGRDHESHGFIYQNATFTTVDAPGALGTSIAAISNNGEIVGSYYTSDALHGLIYDNGTFTTLDYDAAHTATVLTGVNDAGLIVGIAYPQDYEYAGGNFIASPAPLAMAPITYTPDLASYTVWLAEAYEGIQYSELQTLINFSNSQFAWAQHVGLPDPGLYVYEALGAALASTPQGAFLQTTAIANIADDTAFVTAAYHLAFAHDGAPAQIQSFLGLLHFLEAFYKDDAHVPHWELAAKGGTFGLMIGVEAETTEVPIVGTNAA